MTSLLGFSFLVAILSWILTGLIRRYAHSRCLMDVPNERSSHATPTPRGGGVAIVVTFLGSLISLLLLAPDYPDYKAQFIALLGAGTWIALIGFMDDRGHIAARWRLLAHFTGAGWALVWLGGLPPLTGFGVVLDLGWLGHLLALVYLVWLLNLYNFMDGIDGIAGIEAVSVCLGGAVLYGMSGTGSSEWVLPVLLLVAVAGFLFWNFPKALIFMGDAGSGFVGIVLGILSIRAAWVEPELFWGWVILLGAFVVDATVTLVRRVLRGEKFYEAHRSHAYQYASRKYSAHPPVSLAYGAINLFWLMPLAVLVAVGGLDGLLGVLIAYAPLVWLAYHFKAGARELQEPQTKRC
ncbi:MAG: glycosyltransferase family 4 protein [Sedimenticola sp.]